MSIEREQIIRDAKAMIAIHGAHARLAHACLELVSELDEATDAWQLELKRAIAAEARLARMVEALRKIRDNTREPNDGLPYNGEDDLIARAALAAWEAE